MDEIALEFPPNLVLDPIVAVALGAALLGERVPLDAVRIVGYLVCIALIGWAAIRLAEPEH